MTFALVVAVAACGSSKSKSTSTAASPPTTQATSATTPATQSTSSPAAGPNAAVCAQATKDLQPLQAAAASNNTGQIRAQAGQAASKLIKLQNSPGITPQAHAALGQLTGSLEAFAHGARGQALSTELGAAGRKLAAACG